MLRLEVLHEPAKVPAKEQALLFVHGAYHAAWAFRDTWLPYFAANGYDSYAVSLRGHGGSDRAGDPARASLVDFVADLQDVVAQLSRPVVLIGHSLGGNVIQKYLETSPAAGAALLCTSSAADKMKATARIFLRFPWLTIKASLTLKMEYLFHQRDCTRTVFFSGDTAPAIEDLLDRLLAGPSPNRAFQQLLGYRPKPPSQPLPVFVAGGERDPSIPAATLAAWAELYGGEWKCYPGLTHEMPFLPGWEKPASDLLAWLQAAVPHGRRP